MDAALATGRSFWLFTKDPSIQAFTDLMNRSLDKPTEQVQMTVTKKDVRALSDEELLAEALAERARMDDAIAQQAAFVNRRSKPTG